MVIGWLSSRANRVNITSARKDEQAEWMRTTPPAESIAASRADGEGISLYDQDEGEVLAAAFAEQIENAVRAELSSRPELSAYAVDFGTTPDGSLAITVDGKTYLEIKSIPEEPIRSAITQAIAAYNSRK